MIKNHPIYYPLYEDTTHPIILITGGRGSGKSFATSAFIERLTFESKKFAETGKEEQKIVHNILYSRYTMTSANISIIPEFLEKIEADGTERYFRTTKQDITNILTGAKIMFRGIHTSSGNQTAKLKSIHGITTFVCDEAEEWQSEQEFETIKLSIRQKGIRNRVIIIMNPTDKHHFVYRNFIKDTHKIVEFDGVPVQISTHPDVLHIHTSYLDNKEHLSDEFLVDAKRCKETNPERYAHTFMGRWTDEVQGRIFDNVYLVDEFPMWCRHTGVGLDFGFTHDPSAAIRCGIGMGEKGEGLFVDELFYQKGMLISDLIRELNNKVNHPYEQIIADCSEPREIQEIANSGQLIYAVDKSGQSIIAGIDKMKSMPIYVTKKSLNVIEEFKNYTWRRDKDGNWVNVPIDAYNHAIDAIRYYVLGVILGKILQPKIIIGDLPIF